MTEISLKKSLPQNKISWNWQEKEPTGMYEFSIVKGENLTITKNNNVVTTLEMNPSESNHLTFEPDEDGINLIAVFNDLSIIDEGEYDYSILVISAYDSRKIENSGTLTVVP